MLGVVALALVVGAVVGWFARAARRNPAAPQGAPNPAPPEAHPLMPVANELEDAPEPSTSPSVQFVTNNPNGDGTQVPCVLLPGTGRGYFMQIVGESHYQAALSAMRARSPEECQSVILEAEPENAYDPHAVVVKSSHNETIGYLARDVAPRYQPTLLALRGRGVVSLCSAKFYWGHGEKSTGVWLDLEVPTAVAKAVGVKYQRQKSAP